MRSYESKSINVCTWSDSFGCLQFDASNSQCLHSSSNSLLSELNNESELYSYHTVYASMLIVQRG